MTQKERLVELLKTVPTTMGGVIDMETVAKYADEIIDIEYTADYLLENGVIVPPCKVGDVVYWLHVHCTDPSDDDCDGNCYSCGYSSIDIEKRIINSLYRMVIAMESWERCCFPTREVAEQALKERFE